MSENGSDYPVGYRRPPRATQFKPGQSGNKKGRPKEAKGSRTIWDEELKAKVRISENGKTKRISKRRAMIRQTANKAAGGDMKAITLVEAVTREHEAASENAASLGTAVFDRPADAQTMASIVERMRLKILESLATEAAGNASTAPAESAGPTPVDDATDSPAPETGADIPDPKLESDGGSSC